MEGSLVGFLSKFRWSVFVDKIDLVQILLLSFSSPKLDNISKSLSIIWFSSPNFWEKLYWN